MFIISTLKDVALAAGVSPMTVSNVVNGKFEKVSEETIKRINILIKEMNYIPNANARELSTQKSQLIALCIYGNGRQNFLEDPYNSYIVGAVSENARKNGYGVLLENERDILKLSNHLISRNVAGTILLGFSAEHLEEINQSISIPIVCLDTYQGKGNLVTIGTNDFQAGQLAGKYLTHLGHKKIAFASGPSVKEADSEIINPLLHYRFKGFKEALASEGNPFEGNYLFTSEISYEDGIDIGIELSRFNEITAVFCTADILAAGILEGLRLSGIKVPHEMQILGFDNLPISKYVYPKLSTISQQNNLKGEVAVQKLIEMIHNPETFVDSIQYGVSIVERQTTMMMY